jgi:hypothetical protein
MLQPHPNQKTCVDGGDGRGVGNHWLDLFLFFFNGNDASINDSFILSGRFRFKYDILYGRSSFKGGGVKPQIQTFLLSILVVMKFKSVNCLRRLIPIFGSKLQQKVWTKSILSFLFLNEDLHKYLPKYLCITLYYLYSYTPKDRKLNQTFTNKVDLKKMKITLQLVFTQLC